MSFYQLQSSVVILQGSTKYTVTAVWIKEVWSTLKEEFRNLVSLSIDGTQSLTV
jgi:hypothetical protein